MTKTTFERKSDPMRESAQKAAMKQYQRSMQPGQWIGLPNGEAVRVQSHVGFRYPGQKESKMLGTPGVLPITLDANGNRVGPTEPLLLDPKPDFDNGDRYQWRVRTSADSRDTRPAETSQLHRAGRIRYVETEELNPNCDFAVVHELSTPNNSYVTWQSMILCEILDEQLAYDAYQYPVDKGLHNVSNLEASVMGEPGTHIANKVETQVEVGATKRGG
jgi:hypothetical protein